nr:hypothetical protein GCM10020093_091200 [Planobispora longispora]
MTGRMAKEERQVLGLTVGVPGLVGTDGTVLIAPNLGWRDVDLSGDLAKALRDPGFPVQIDNDANLAALAEHRFGAQAGTANLVYLTGEIGVGAGVILDGRLRRGAGGTAARSATSSSTRSAPSAAAGGSAAWRPSPGSGRCSSTRRSPRPRSRSSWRRWYGWPAPATAAPWTCSPASAATWARACP